MQKEIHLKQKKDKDGYYFKVTKTVNTRAYRIGTRIREDSTELIWLFNGELDVSEEQRIHITVT